MDSSTAINRNTDGLKAFVQKKKEYTLQRVNEAIQKLIEERAKINFNSVSMESGVTKHTFTITWRCEIELKLYVIRRKAYHHQSKLKKR